jgi:hypothetical protein
MSRLKNTLQREFLDTLGAIHPGFLNEDAWNERRQKEVNAGLTQFSYSDYYDEIKRAWLDLSSTLDLAEKCYYLKEIDEINLTNSLEKYILKKKTDSIPCPVYYRKDHTEFLRHLFTAFMKAIKKVRWDEQISAFKVVASDKVVVKGKPGPKGPRPDVVRRRTIIAALYERGFRGRKLCVELTEKRQPLPTNALQITYRFNWILWYEKDRKSVYRQLADDRKRTPKRS